MSILTGVLGFFNLVESTISTLLLSLIYRYIQSKPLGLQSVLDLLSLDCIRVWITYTILANSIIYSGLCYGQFDFTTAQVMVGTSVNVFVLLMALIQVTIVVKAVLIFKGDWLSEISDSNLIWICRLVSVVYVVARFLVDVRGEPKAVPFLYMLTGTDAKTSLAIGPGFLVVLALLLITLTLLKIKTPTLPEDQQGLYNMSTKMAFLGCLTLFGSAASVINAIQSHDQIEVFLTIWIIFWFIIGIVLPGNFILGLPNLKNWVFQRIQEIREMFSFSLPSFPSNRIDVIV